MRSWAKRWAWMAAAAVAFSIYTPIAGSQEPDTDDEETGDQGAPSFGPPAGASAADRKAWLVKTIDDLIVERTRLAGAKIGIHAVDLNSGEVLYDKNGSTAMNVASNTKLVTTATVLARLGPQFRFRTGVYAQGVDANGVIAGDLYIKGGGDPSIGTLDLISLADDLAQAGVKRIRGGIVIDASYFDDEELPPHFEEQPKEQAAFRAPIGALSLNFNSVAIVVTPNRSGGGPARIELDPPNDYVKIVGEIQTVSSGRSRVRVDTVVRKRIMELKVSGQVPATAASKRYRRRVHDPVIYFGAAFRAQLRARGIGIGSKPIARGKVGKRMKRLAVRGSPPLAVLVRGMGKYSNNYVAEMVLKGAGAEAHPERPGTWADGQAEVRAHMTETVGLEPGTFRCDNGSGLFDSNELSPVQLVAVLAAARRDFRYGPDLLGSLAIAGSDGTLRRRMKDTPAQGRLRAKTGTLATVSALSGYVAYDAAHPVAFSVVVNDIPHKGAAKREARSLQDGIGAALAAYLSP